MTSYVITVVLAVVLTAVAAALVTWAVIGAPMPARLPGPWWTRQAWAAIWRHTLRRARRLRYRNTGRPAPTGDEPTLNLRPPGGSK